MPTPTSSLGMQDFFTTTLSAAVTDANQLTIYLNSVPTNTEGYLVIDYANSTTREIIFYSAVGANYVTVPADGRGQGGTTAQAHDLGADVRQNMVSGYWDALKNGQLAGGAGWEQAGTLAYASADSPTFTATIATDLTSKFYPGVRVQLSQTQALSHYWTFDTNSAADVGSATMADIGTPTYTAGKFGNALTLNGTDQALSITDAAAFHLGASGAEFTIGCWFKTSTTNATQRIFQSYSDNTNSNGFNFQVTNANAVGITLGYNAADGIQYLGTTTVTDGNWHSAVVSFRNNYVQIYVDGKLENSSYAVTPTYAATTYTQIGVANNAGSNIAATWFNGQIDDLFLINGYALDEQTIAAKYAAATAQGTGDLTLTKYFLCTASSYSAPNTTVTMYGGTDHSLANATISNAYYSTQKAPYGFPLGQEKWTVTATNTVGGNKVNPAQNTWYHTDQGSQLISVPIGKWNLGYSIFCSATRAAASYNDAVATLGTTAAAETDGTLTTRVYGYVQETGATLSAYKLVSLPVKTTYYLSFRTTKATQTGLSCAGNPGTIRATSTLL